MREWGWFFQQRIKLAKALLRSNFGTKLLTRAMPPNIPYMAVECLDGTFVTPSTDAVTRRLIRTGEWFHDETEKALDFIRAETGKNSDLVAIEIGGHIGTQTVQFAKSGLFRRIITAEPLPEIHRLLRANLELNGVAEIVTPLMVGIDQQPGNLKLYTEGLNSAKGSLITVADNRHDTGLRIPVVPMSEFLSMADQDPSGVDLLWIDAEGMEFEIMKSCKDAGLSPEITIIEYSPMLYGPDKTAEFFEFLKSEFTTVRQLERGELRSTDWEAVEKVEKQADLILT